MSSCFENVDTAQKAQSSTDGSVKSDITESDFSGANLATNKVTGIEVSWIAATKTVQSYRLYRVRGATMDLIASVGSQQTSVIDGSVTWGAIYSYVVKAVDVNGIEDANNNRVSALAWGGLASAAAESPTAIRVTFDTSSAIANEIRIYIKPNDASSPKTLVASVSPNLGSYLITGLRPGFSYQVTAQAFVDSLKKEDGNSANWIINTNTLGFHDNGVDLAKWRNVISARAFGVSPGSPTHPTLPEKSPTGNVTELSFLPFSGVPVTQKYVVIRAAEGQDIDTSAVQACTTSTTQSCRPCGVLTQNTATVFCRDQNVAGSPARYRYTMALLHEDAGLEWVEPLPLDKVQQFSILVPIPPKDMVLVQRDAANYEMCVTQMNKSSDPKNKNRCAYSGAGSVPYNSNPGKPALNMDRSFYDLGYNFFTTRYPMGCRWTTAADGGMCGPGQTPGDCAGVAGTSGNPTAPSNTLGKDGDVYWTLGFNATASGYNGCYMKINGSWMSSADFYTRPDTTALLAQATTFHPEENNKKIPRIHYYSRFITAMETCKAHPDPNYGPMRLPRLREHRALSAWPTVPGEPYSTNYATALNTYSGGYWNSVDGFRCENNVANMNTVTGPNMIGATLNDLLTNPSREVSSYLSGGINYGSRQFFLGAQQGVDCRTRYGAYNVADTPTSDAFMYNASNGKHTGIASPLDSGNLDLVTDVNGGNTGYVLDTAGSIVEPNGSNPYYRTSVGTAGPANYNFINLALGLPAYTSTSTQYNLRTSFSEVFGSNFYYNYASAPTIVHMVRTASRWGTYLIGTTGIAAWSSGHYCVLPAE